MVCKEDLCLWFRNLNPRKRIEYMCELLHMCLPLELRFVGTVLESYGKRDYHYLRNHEVAANKQTEIQKYKNIKSPEGLRAKVFITLALMRSSSTTCAQTIYEIIQSKLTTVFSFGPNDDSSVVDEILTVLTLAANHPAFVFDQRRRLHDHLRFLDSQRRDTVREQTEDEEIALDLYPDNHIPHYPVEDPQLSLHPVLCNRHSPAPQPRRVFVSNIEVRWNRKSAEKKMGPEYLILATWSNGETTEVGKRFREIQNFHQQMVEMFPDEKPPNGRIPNLPTGSPHQPASREHISEQIRTLAAYFRSLTDVPSHVLESDHVCQFFRGSVIRPAPPPPMIASSLSYHHPDEEETMSTVPPHLKSMSLRNSHLYYLTPQLNDAASRLPRLLPTLHPNQLYMFPQRFPTSNLACPTLLMSAHHIPLQQQHQQQQPSPVSPPRSERSSTTASPTGSRSTSPDLAMSVPHLLKRFGLEKYINTLGALSLEQLLGLTCEDLGKFGLLEDVQDILTKVEQIKRYSKEKNMPINGLVDGMVYPSFSLYSPSSPSSLQFVPATAFTQPRIGLPASSPRSGMSINDTSPGALSDIASGGSPPVSPGPTRLQAGLLGKAPPGDSSEGSEDLDRDKSDSLSDTVKNTSHQQGKSVQVKVSPSGGGGGGTGGGSGSPRPPSANSRMTPPEEGAVKQPLLPMQAVTPTIMPYLYHPTPIPAGAPPGLMGQYVDPKGDVGMMGVVHNANNNTNNNYTTEAIPIMSTGIQHRQALLPSGGGSSSVRPPFKTAQPQPAHTSMSVLHGKSLITMPAEPKPGSPVVPFVNLRPEMQSAMGQAGSTQMEGAAQRMSLYLPYGRGQGGPVATAHLPPVHPSQPGAFSFPLVTRSVHTSLPGSASVMTVSASNPVTMVTASHSSAATSTSVHRSPSHGNGNGNGQRDSGAESISGSVSMVSDATMQSAPLQVAGGGGAVSQATAAPSPPASHNTGCQVCAQGTQYSHNQFGHVPYAYPPFLVPQGPNGFIPLSAMSGYYPSNQHALASGVLANGFTSDMYQYTPPGYPSLNPSTGHMYPMMHGNALYQGTPAQPGMATGPASSGVSMGPPQPSAGGAGGLAAAGQQASNVSVKQRNTGCYNCGSLVHRAADCHESSMETMSGKSVYSLDFRPSEESD